MTSATLGNLPTETLQLIFSSFCLHCRAKHQPIEPNAHLHSTQQDPDKPSWYSLKRHALFSLCLVSRRFRDIAQAILYHEFVPGYGDSWRSTMYTWDGRLTSFMQTVAQRRDLATLVKRIYVHPYLLESIGNEEARDALKQAAHALRIEPWQQLSGDELVTILIAELPNLEHFSLQVGEFPVASVSLSVLQVAGISRLPLRTIDISRRATPSFTGYPGSLFILGTHARVIFELATSLETLNLHMCDGISLQSPIPSLRNLKTLRITFSRLNERCLDGLLSSCAGLRTFVYEAASPAVRGEFDPRYDGGDHFQSPDAVRCLRRHCGTLKSLHLDLRQRALFLYPFNGLIRPTFSLKDFTALEHLLINLSEIYDSIWKATFTDNLLLVQLLPPSIASLRLVGGNVGDVLPRLAKGLLSLARKTLQGQFPRLKQVRCDVQVRLDDEYSVRAKFAAAGVDFGYDSWPHSKTTLEQSDVPPSPTSYEPMPLPEVDDDTDL